MSPSAAAPDLTRAQAWLDDAHHGEAAAATRARHELEAVLSADPEQALARALFGVALVLEARDAPLSAKRARAEAGFREIDAAVALAPEEIEVRLLRATNACQMPLVLGRAEVARADFAWLLERIDRAPAVSDGQRRRILFQAGACALKERRMEALSLLERALAAPGAEPPEAAIKSMLALARRELTPPVDAHAPEKAQTDGRAP